MKPPADSSYPVFIPPQHLSRKTPRDWTKDEASEYKAWLLGVSEQRVATLLGYFDEDIASAPELLLRRLGKKVSNIIGSSRFSEIGATGTTLTNEGYALAADMGLLVAKLLLDACPHLHWRVVRRPRSDASYNLPVLAGSEQFAFDPIEGSIAATHGILRGTHGPGVWVEGFKDLKVKACPVRAAGSGETERDLRKKT